MTDIATEELTEFLNYIWGEEAPIEGQATFCYVPVEHGGDWTKYTFEWPRQRTAVVRHILKWSAFSANVFYSPALYRASRPVKENVLGSWFFWVDFDGNAPEKWEDLDIGVSIPEPSLIIQSSLPGHEHCYWQLDEFLTDISLLEERNRALAYILKADTSGWDADQILRPIHTMNYKRNLPVKVKGT
jgi:hypothetical protein